VRVRDDPCTNVSGLAVPTGIHFAFTDRLIERKWDNDPRKPFFQVWRERPNQNLPRLHPPPNQSKLMMDVSDSADFALPPPARKGVDWPVTKQRARTELEGFSPSSNLICNCRKGASVTRQMLAFGGSWRDQ
jgi:hypothetical protein